MGDGAAAVLVGEGVRQPEVAEVFAQDLGGVRAVDNLRRLASESVEQQGFEHEVPGST